VAIFDKKKVCFNLFGNTEKQWQQKTTLAAG
jgi:hypothetical protein